MYPKRYAAHAVWLQQPTIIRPTNTGQPKAWAADGDEADQQTADLLWTSNICEINFNINLSSIIRSPKQPLPFKFFD